MSEVRILIVDDEREFAATLTERLRLRGYEARAAFTAEEALAAAPVDVEVRPSQHASALAKQTRTEIAPKRR
mgnify:CR=1 FL=1